jgi:hypothetical protein
MNLKMN